MKKEDIKLIIKVAFIIALIIVAIKFFVYILPVIVILAAFLFLYDWYIGYKAKKQDDIREAKVLEEKDDSHN